MTSRYMWTGRLREECAALGAWWLGEMQALGRAVLARAVPGMARRVLVRFHNDEAEIAPIHGTSREPTRIRAEKGEWPGSLDAPNGDAGLPGAEAVIVLARRDVLVHEITLPAALERTLQQVLALHVERDFPLERERIIADFRVRRRDRRARTIEVQVFVAHRQKVEALRGLAERWQLRPIRVAVPTEGSQIHGDFLRSGSRARAVGMTLFDRRLAVCASVLAALWLGLVAAQWGYERVMVGRAASEARAAAASVDELIARSARESEAAAALAQRIDMPDALDVLARLTEVVPDDAWAFDVDIDATREPRVKLGAITTADGPLVQTLEGSPYFADVDVQSAVSAGIGSRQDRLTLTAGWEGRPR